MNLIFEDLINNISENTEYKQYFSLAFLLFITFLFLYFIDKFVLVESKKKNLTEYEVYDYIEENIYDNIFYRNLIKLITPDKGDVVTLKDGRWGNLFGKITRYNYEDSSYNIKITKKLNPNNSDFPKRIINRDRDEFYTN